MKSINAFLDISSCKLKTACLVPWEPTLCQRASESLRKSTGQRLASTTDRTFSAPELVRHGSITMFSLRSGTACHSALHIHHLRSFLKHCVPGLCTTSSCNVPSINGQSEVCSPSTGRHARALSGTTFVDT